MYGIRKCFVIKSIYGYKRIPNRGSVKILKTRHKISVDIGLRIVLQCRLHVVCQSAGVDATIS